ncbi:hypothetical protein ABPG72_003253 [Tetrahymena utriculariae]
MRSQYFAKHLSSRTQYTFDTDNYYQYITTQSKIQQSQQTQKSKKFIKNIPQNLFKENKRLVRQEARVLIILDQKFQNQYFVNNPYSRAPTILKNQRNNKSQKKEEEMDYRNKNQPQYIKRTGNNNNNQHYRNNNNQITKVGEIENGQFLIDEFGQKFLQKIDKQYNIRKRIFLYKNDSGRALHEMKVKYSLVEKKNQQSVSQKAVIESVEDKYSEIKPLIGFFSNTPKRPNIDFDLQSKQLRYTNLKKIYFFPLQVNYPTMVLELNDDSYKTCLNGDIFKHYYIVRVIDWPERLSKEGPLVEVLEQRGLLYDQESDCQALLESLNMNSTISNQEKEQVDKIVKDHQNLFKKNKNSKEYENLNVFTIDQQGTQTFDDAFSFQKINSKILEKQIQLAKQPKKCQKEQNEPVQAKGQKTKGKKDKQENLYEVKKKDYLEHENESEAKQEQQEPIQSIEEQKKVDQAIKQQQTDFQEEQKQQESVQDDTGCTRKIFKLGIHIADLSQSIQKDTELYQALEKRGQSIYVSLGKNKSFVKHMLDKKLVQLFSLKAGEKKQAKSLFICLELNQNKQFVFLWDSLRLEDTIIQSKQNYSYEEFDSYLKDNKQSISELYKDDEEITSSDDEEDDDDDEDDGIGSNEREKIPKNKNLILTEEEFLNFFQIGGQLLQQRLKKGQRAFQEEFTEKDRYVSSKLVEELMIFYNQSISRQIQVSQQIFKGQKDVDKKVEELKEDTKKMTKSIESNKSLIQAQLKKQQKALVTNQKTLNTLNKNIKGTKTQIDNKPRLLQEYEKKILANTQKIEELKKQIEQINLMDDSQFEQEFNKNKKQVVEKYLEAKEKDEDQKIEEEQFQDSNLNQFSQLSQLQFQQMQFPQKKQNQPSDMLQIGENKFEQQQIQNNQVDSDENHNSDEESDTKSMNSQNNNNGIINNSENIYTSQKQRLTKQLQKLNQQLEQLNKDLNNLANQKVFNHHEEAKKSIKDTLDHYKNKCELAGFKFMKFDSLQDFQSSIDKLKYTKITPIIKKYLIFEKRKIVKQLNQYFFFCDDQKKQEQQHSQKLQQKNDQHQKIIKDIEAIKDKITQAEKNEEDQKIKDLEHQNHEQIQVDEEIFTEGDETETRSQISIQDSECQDKQNVQKISLKQTKIIQLQQQIKLKENEIKKFQKFISQKDSTIQELNSKLEKFEDQHNKLIDQIKTQETQINELKMQQKELELEIKKLDQNLKDEQNNLQQQLEKDVNETYKHFDLTPESEKYLSLTSPIRKFNDIQAQQFIDQYLNEEFFQKFDQEYTKIIKSKQNITKIKNQLGKFLEKAEKIKNCRKMIHQAQERQNVDQTQEILQINCKLISKFMIYDFFLPKQMQIVQLKNDRKIPQLSSTFSIWKGQIQAKLSLPYDYTVQKAQLNNIQLLNMVQ